MIAAAGAKNFAGMAVLRFVLGGIESLITPTFVLIVSDTKLHDETIAYVRTGCTTHERSRSFEQGRGHVQMVLAVSESPLGESIVLMDSHGRRNNRIWDGTCTRGYP